ncbi:UTP--glucose-1-phosphate uridylyltransferase GalU [Cohnella candidum]|uniref:UTP--glucose-1-phosphate uridylyltransferase n=1 Tax=Cohnella candidum TaxID=2674991 RepID=A0A3G3JT88_9BACL|nr:UTP--glucose-1-phosphate uridylyltransferase GalU [Cohnella candidum]AYQ71440.1 UTP--glucose-1-phosphate uridylyltransferase [Cohnella candidum]
MKKVTKAVIPAAGWGTRFLPATKAIPKEMFPIVDKPVIQYIVEEAAEAGIEDILIVTGERKGAIGEHFGSNPELEAALRSQNKDSLLQTVEQLARLANIHFTVQKQPLGLGHAVLCAREFVGEEPFAVLLGDTVRADTSGGIKPLTDVYREKQCSVIAVEPVDWSEVGNYGIVDGSFENDRLMLVNRLVEKPRENPPSNFAIMGRYILEPDIFPILGSLSAGAGGEIQLTDALQQLANGQAFYAHVSKFGLHDVGNRLGYLQAAVLEGLRERTLKEPFGAFLKKVVSELHD